MGFTNDLNRTLEAKGSLVAKLRAENKRLLAIVAKLPKTKDGVPVVPGMNLWCLDGAHPYQWYVQKIEVRETIRYGNIGTAEGLFHEASEGPHDIDACYSTRKALEARKEPSGGR